MNSLIYEYPIKINTELTKQEKSSKISEFIEK